MGAPDHQAKVSHCIRSDVIRPVGQRCTRARRPAWIASSTVHLWARDEIRHRKTTVPPETTFPAAQPFFHLLHRAFRACRRLVVIRRYISMLPNRRLWNILILALAAFSAALWLGGCAPGQQDLSADGTDTPAAAVSSAASPAEPAPAGSLCRRQSRRRLPFLFPPKHRCSRSLSPLPPRRRPLQPPPTAQRRGPRRPPPRLPWSLPSPWSRRTPSYPSRRIPAPFRCAAAQFWIIWMRWIRIRPS